MSKNTNLSFLTDFITADIVNSRVGINNASPQTTFDVTGTGKFSGILTLGSTISNGTYAYTLPSATGTLALTSDLGNYVTLGTAQTITGEKIFTNSIILKNSSTGLVLSSFSPDRLQIGGVTYASQIIFPATSRTWNLPDATGTIALVGGSGVGTVTSVGLSSATSGVTIGSTPVTTSGTITLAIATASGSQNGLLSSTDWTTFNNKQNALTNPVTGTGTTNYLPKFTGSTTIGNSQIFDNGTNVGINTNTPLSTNLLGALTIVKSYSSDTPASTTAQTYYTNQSGLYLFGRNSGLTIVGVNNEENQIIFANTSTVAFASINTGTGSNSTGGDMYFKVGSNTEAMRIFATTRNVHIGPTPVSDNGARLQVSGTATFSSNQNATITYTFQNTDSTNTNSRLKLDFISGNSALSIVSIHNDHNYIASLAGKDLYFQQSFGGTSNMVIKSGGNVLIGTTTDAGVKLQVSGGATFSSSVAVNSNVNIVNYTTESSLFVGGAATNGVSNGIILLQSGRIPQSGSDTTGTNGLLFQHTISNATNVNGGYIYNGRETVFGSASVVNTFISFATTLANTNYERIRITSDGILKMSNNSTTFSIGAIGGVQRIQHGTNGFTTEFQFFGAYDGYAPIGASAFNTRSDYRLKEDLKEFSGLSLVTDMKVYDFKWKEQDERNYGFMAHELQEILPYVVTGTKDGMFEGELQMQGVDYSKLVPVLVKAIQELKQEIDTLKS